MDVKMLGLLTGIIFGIVLFWLGVGEAFAVVFLALLGWFIGKLLNREIDIAYYLEAISRRKDTK